MNETISLPKELLKQVGKIVENSSLGYNSNDDFIAEATRQRIIQIKKLDLNKLREEEGLEE